MIYSLQSIQIWPRDKEVRARDLPGCPEVVRLSDGCSDVLNLTFVGASEIAIQRVIDAINAAIADARAADAENIELEAVHA